ncbi:MAG TPA: 30S ribosome-binding factor RbfA [Desulfotomaculum sp.]|nr:MAG: ribosome-binding factor A [Desulfotomaculum sp. BICA1-6]HBX23768.1 30S ribosome-binding factor RbfA [Desulfotomaculum sp.]
MSHRPEKLAESIKKETSEMLRAELKDPRVGFATVTGVEVSGDLKYAKIYVSVLGAEKERDLTMAALKKAQGFIRTELGRRIRMRQVPEVSFKLDESLDHGARIIELLNEVRVKDD